MTPSTDRRILALQYWSGDRDDSLRLARYIADIEPGFNPHVDFVFAVRSDAQGPDEFTVKKVSSKFNVKTMHAPRAGTGHPWGCWILWYSLIEWLLKQQEAKAFSCKWALTFESDSLPLTRTWLDSLDQEWDRHQPDCHMMGCNPRGGVSHINGNCLVSGAQDYLRWIVRDIGIDCLPHRGEGWDTWLFPEFLTWGCVDTPLMRSDWRLMGAPVGFYKRMVSEGVLFHHGCKDSTLMRQTRAALLGRSIQL